MSHFFADNSFLLFAFRAFSFPFIFFLYHFLFFLLSLLLSFFFRCHRYISLSAFLSFLLTQSFSFSYFQHEAFCITDVF